MCSSGTLEFRRDNSTPPILKASTHKALSLTNTLHRFQSGNSFLCLCSRANTLPNNSLIAMAAPVPNSTVRNVADLPELEASQLPTQGGQDSQVTVASGSPSDKTPSVEVDVPTIKTSGGSPQSAMPSGIRGYPAKHSQGRAPGANGRQGRCLRDRVPAVSKWGKEFSDAVAAKVAELRSSS